MQEKKEVSDPPWTCPGTGAGSPEVSHTLDLRELLLPLNHQNSLQRGRVGIRIGELDITAKPVAVGSGVPAPSLPYWQ